MTQNDLELKTMARAALRKFLAENPPIDWEQRRYEIAKDVLGSFRANGATYGSKEDCRLAIVYADELIKQLKGDKQWHQ